jgi:hypothetical protein
VRLIWTAIQLQTRVLCPVAWPLSSANREPRGCPSRSAILATCLVLAATTALQAQTAPTDSVWSRGTTLNVFVGVASGSPSSARPLVGAALGWEFTPWVGLEGSGAWLDRAGDASAFAATLRANLNLTRPRVVVPFVGVGVGLYRASFDVRNDAIPGFYLRRIDTSLVGTTQTFTDPSFVMGGGLNVFTTDRWALRPHAELIIVRRDSQHYTVPSFVVHVAYHFEGHRVLPRRNP